MGMLRHFSYHDSDAQHVRMCTVTRRGDFGARVGDALHVRRAPSAPVTPNPARIAAPVSTAPTPRNRLNARSPPPVPHARSPRRRVLPASYVLIRVRSTTASSSRSLFVPRFPTPQHARYTHASPLVVLSGRAGAKRAARAPSPDLQGSIKAIKCEDVMENSQPNEGRTECECAPFFFEYSGLFNAYHS